MTQSSLQTQCPKCETRFRVTDAQLSVASGKVRCGNCMSVFNAIDHQIQQASAPPVEPKRAPDAPSAQPAESEDNFVFADNPEEDAAESTYTGTRLTFTDEELSDSFRSTDEKGGTSGFTADDDEEVGNSVDESWAEAILSDDDRPAPQPESAPETEPEPEPKPELKPEPDLELEPQPEPKSARTAAQQPPSSAPELPDDDYDGFFIDESESPGFDYEMDEPVAEPVPGPRTTESPYQNLRREPVGVSGGGSGRLRGFLWFVVILGLIGGLVSQVVWFQFDRLSAIPQLRPFYEQGCEIFRCELKPLINVQSIQSRKLVVKTNPDNRSQLVVDAVIINRAAFEQPFPAIALTFSNLNNDVVAQSVFTPTEYLAGDGADMTAMPTDTPVRIVINIRDPGKDAVNYNIAFKAHTP